MLLAEACGRRGPRFPDCGQKEWGGETSSLPSQGPGDTVTGSQEDVMVSVSHIYQPKEAVHELEGEAHLLFS